MAKMVLIQALYLPPPSCRLLEMGFKEEISEVVRMAPRKRQTLLFSATFTPQVQGLHGTFPKICTHLTKLP